MNAGRPLNLAPWQIHIVEGQPVHPGNKYVWSPEIRRMLGFADESDFPNILSSWSDRLHPDDADRVIAAFEEHLADRYGQAPMDIEYRLKLKNGRYNHFRSFCNTLRDQVGVPLVVTGALLDVTEGRLKLSRLERRGRLLDLENRMAALLLSIKDEATFDSSLMKSMELMGRWLDADRVQIWRNEARDGIIYYINTYAWFSEIGRQLKPMPIGMEFSRHDLPPWEPKFLRGEYIAGPLAGLSPEARDFLEPYGVRSIVIIPLFLRGELWGFFNISDCHNDRGYSEEEIRTLRSAGLMLASAIDGKRHIDQMREADIRAQLMFDATPLCVNFWVKVPGAADDGRVAMKLIDCNLESVKLFELAEKREYVDKFFDLSPKYQPCGRLSTEKALDYIDQAFKEGYCRFEWLHQKLNGEPLPCEITLVRIKHRGDYILAGYSRDLRELKATLAKIAEGGAKIKALAHWHKSILDAIPLPISVTDADMNWIFINQAAENMLNMKREDVLGRPRGQWADIVYGSAERALAALTQGQKQVHFKHQGESYQVDIEMLRNVSGDISGFIEAVQNITKVEALAKRQAEAEAANAAKSSFLTRMSHEIRTPMNAIMVIAEMQMQNKALSTDVREALGRIHSSGDLLMKIINDILDLSKIEAGRLDLSPVNYEVASLISDAALINITQFAGKAIKFDLKVDANTPASLYGDEVRIRQILNNLLSNAFKYTDSGRITMSVFAEPNETGVALVFRVSDTGQGMTPEQLETLFAEYTRFNFEANRTTVGTGMGMNIANHLVHMMNGEISVASAPGRGSTFTVRLPQRDAGAGPIGRDAAEALQKLRFAGQPQIHQTQIRREPMPYGGVLVVDDVETNIYVAKLLLAPYELRVDTAQDAAGAIEKIKRGQVYDIVFMDHMMPVMDGVEATNIIRGLGYGRPIVALTANALTGYEEMFLASGFDGFISKPVDVRQLDAVLNKFIRDRQSPEVIEAARRGVRPAADETRYSSERLKLDKAFVHDAAKAAKILEGLRHKRGALDDEDFKIYTISAHSLKTVLAVLGENELSSLAYRLETAGRQRDADLMAAETQAFLEALQAVIRAAASRVEAVDGAGAEPDLALLREKLLIIRAACGGSDKKTAKTALAALARASWPRRIRERLDSLAALILLGNFEEAAAVVAEITCGP